MPLNKPVLVDFESRSKADLKIVGGRRYWEDPSTEVVVACWHDTASGQGDVWYPGEPWPHHGRQLIAHNASGFDRFGGDRSGWRCAWLDSADFARRSGRRGKLEAFGEEIGVPKDKIGNRLTKSLSAIKRPKSIKAAEWKAFAPEQKRLRGVLADIPAEKLVRVSEYCQMDVEIMVRGWGLLEPWADVDEDVATVTQAINDRGVAFDRELAEALLDADRTATERVIAECARELGMTPERCLEIVRSPAQLGAALGTPDCRAETLASIPHPLAVARRASATIAQGKLVTGLARVSDDGRLRDSIQYHAAHTGRWGGRGFQPHNLPRAEKRFEETSNEELHELAERVRRRSHRPSPAEVELLLRAILWAPDGRALVVLDYSGIENRWLSWSVGNQDALADFAAGVDPYVVEASGLFGLDRSEISKAQRAFGKVSVLGCGYQMGPGKLSAQARSLAGIDLPEASDAPDAMTSVRVVRSWRERHPLEVSHWYDCQRAFQRAAEGRPTRVACYEFCPGNDGSIAVILPSGRPVVYRGVRVTGSGRRADLSYEGGKGTEHVYGGKIVENLVQASCRDLLADTLIRAERAGLHPVLHVHDEAVLEVDEGAAEDARAELREIMTSPPSWAAGCPLGVSGFVGRRYRKL